MREAEDIECDHTQSTALYTQNLPSKNWKSSDGQGKCEGRSSRLQMAGPRAQGDPGRSIFSADRSGKSNFVYALLFGIGRVVRCSRSSHSLRSRYHKFARTNTYDRFTSGSSGSGGSILMVNNQNQPGLISKNHNLIERKGVGCGQSASKLQNLPYCRQELLVRYDLTIEISVIPVTDMPPGLSGFPTE